MPLFKYLRREHAEALLTQGVVRLGTLHDFRNFEESDLARRDAKEGKKTVRKPFPYTVLHGTPEDEPARRRMANELGFVVPPGAKRVEVAHNVVTSHAESVNAFIYSTSAVYDPHLLSEFSADVAVVITNPDAFFHVISRHLGDRASALRIDRCIYAPREHLEGSVPDIHPCWLKDLEYAPQQEVRAAWMPSTDHPEPLLLQCPELSLFCAPFEEDTPVPSGAEFVARIMNDMTLPLDGLHFTNCTFNRCTLVYSGGPMELVGNSFQDCRWVFTDAALRTFAFLRAHHAGTREGTASQVTHWLEQPLPDDASGH